MNRTPTTEELEWAAAAMDARINAGSPEDYEEPEPPDSIQKARERRKRDRKARRCAALAVEYGYADYVPYDDRCIGMGPVCALCGEELPAPGDPPQACDRRSG